MTRRAARRRGPPGARRARASVRRRGRLRRAAAGPPTFSTTVQSPCNRHTTTIQSTKDGPPCSRYVALPQVRQPLVPPYNRHTTAIQPEYSLLKMGHPLHALPQSPLAGGVRGLHHHSLPQARRRGHGHGPRRAAGAARHPGVRVAMGGYAIRWQSSSKRA